MATDEMDEIVRTCEDLADFDGPVSELQVCSAEEALGVKFPESYRKFLLQYGCGDIAGVEFFGICRGGDIAAPSVVFMTKSMRDSTNLPRHLIYVCDSGSDWQYMIDTSQANGNEAPIIEWYGGQAENKQDCRPKYSSFSSFFVDMVRSAAEDE